MPALNCQIKYLLLHTYVLLLQMLLMLPWPKVSSINQNLDTGLLRKPPVQVPTLILFFNHSSLNKDEFIHKENKGTVFYLENACPNSNCVQKECDLF